MVLRKEGAGTKGPATRPRNKAQERDNEISGNRTGIKKADKKRHCRAEHVGCGHKGEVVLRGRWRKVPVCGGWLGEGCQV